MGRGFKVICNIFFLICLLCFVEIFVAVFTSSVEIRIWVSTETLFSPFG